MATLPHTSIKPIGLNGLFVKAWDTALRKMNSGKADTVDGATADNIATLDADGNLQDGGQGLPAGTILGTTDAQTVTNKIINADDNTISNLAHGAEVDSPSSGVHGVTGSVVGTTDAQALSAKTLTSPVINTGVSGTALATTVSTPGSDTIIVSEQGIREALTALGGAKFTTFTYNGGGAATQAVTGFGFRPKGVIVWDVTALYFALIKTDQDGVYAKALMATAYYLDDQIISIDADGVTFGDGTGSSGRINMTRNTIKFVGMAWG